MGSLLPRAFPVCRKKSLKKLATLPGGVLQDSGNFLNERLYLCYHNIYPSCS
jgi:hypothetical protein